MRRKDREMDRKFALEVIDKAKFATISVTAENSQPYGLPLSIVRDGSNLYFHSAKEGTKVKLFEQSPLVNVVFVGNVKIPENFTKDELDEIVQDKAKIPQLISKVFTTEFESAIVRGKVTSVEDGDEKIKAMRLICEKYTDSKMEYFDAAIKAGLPRAKVYKIEIEEITAKRKKYNDLGEEIKGNLTE